MNISNCIRVKNEYYLILRYKEDGIFGKDQAKQLFTGKEVVICLDAETEAIYVPVSASVDG